MSGSDSDVPGASEHESGDIAATTAAATAQSLKAIADSLQSLAKGQAALTKCTEASLVCLQIFSKQPVSRRKLKKHRSPSPSSNTSSRSLSPAESYPSQGQDDHTDSDEDWDAQQSSRVSTRVDSLIEDIREVLQLSEPGPPVINKKAQFKRPKYSAKVFPTTEETDQIISAEWKHPARRATSNKRCHLMYPFPKDKVDLWTKSPTVDPPISRLSKATTIPCADPVSFKDPLDRRIESFAKAAFESAGTSMLPALASGWTAKASTQWLSQLKQGIKEGAEPSSLLALVDKLSSAQRFITEASVDSLSLAARTSSATIALRRVTWLRAWSADSNSKRRLTSLPFAGLTLFGKELADIIEEATGGKSKHLPQNRPRWGSRRSPSRRWSGKNNSFRTFSRRPAAQHSSTSKQGGRQKPPWRSKLQPNKPVADRQPTL